MLGKAGAVLILVISASAAARAGDSISLDQQDSYTYTKVIQHKRHTTIKTRALNERSYDRVSERLADRSARMAGRTIQIQSRCPAGAGGNNAAVQQTGSDNIARDVQMGSNDAVSIQQDGSQDIVYTYQFGNDQTALADQTGSHEIALIVQRCR